MPGFGQGRMHQLSSDTKSTLQYARSNDSLAPTVTTPHTMASQIALPPTPADTDTGMPTPSPVQRLASAFEKAAISTPQEPKNAGKEGNAINLTVPDSFQETCPEQHLAHYIPPDTPAEAPGKPNTHTVNASGSEEQGEAATAGTQLALTSTAQTAALTLESPASCQPDVTTPPLTPPSQPSVTGSPQSDPPATAGTQVTTTPEQGQTNKQQQANDQANTPQTEALDPAKQKTDEATQQQPQEAPNADLEPAVPGQSGPPEGNDSTTPPLEGPNTPAASAGNKMTKYADGTYWRP